MAACTPSPAASSTPTAIASLRRHNLSPSNSISFCIRRAPRDRTIRSLPIAGSGEAFGDPSTLNSMPSSFEFLALKREMDKEEGAGREVVSEPVTEREDEEKGARSDEKSLKTLRRKKQMVRRSAIMAKQVISIRSARGLGFVSQLWIDSREWVVISVEVRPNLLSGETEKFLFEDICKVGDVVLVEDENVVDNELQMIGLDSLVGYHVVTSSNVNIGKVRGYSFDIDSGAVESLELDSFGLSIVPATLVSTYNLYVEDILDMISDTIVVHDDAVSRVQRLSKGIWDGEIKNGPRYPPDECGEASWPSERRAGRWRHKSDNARRLRRRHRRDADDRYELPFDYR